MAGTMVLTSTTVIGKSNPPARIANAKELLVSWVGDASDGTVPTLLIDSLRGWYITKVVTNPGTTAPTADYDITFIDADGIDIMDGGLANRSDTASERVLAAELVGADGFTITIANQSVHSATGTIRIFAVR
jgi:hypothetical protein